MTPPKRLFTFQKNNLLIGTALLWLLLFSSCGGYSALVGKYPDSYTFNSSSGKEQLWNNLIDFFTKYNITMTTIDKPSGLIVSNQYSFAGSYTREDTLGHLKNPNAWVVGNFKPQAPPDNDVIITGNINVHITQDNGQQKVVISITGLSTNAAIRKNMMLYSTGVLEGKIGQIVTQ